jgi:alpha-1,2-mannosyltransferase
MVLGLLCYKPHFGLLVPVGLAFGGHWRAFAAAGATVICLIGLSMALFGIETWHAYAVALAGSDTVYASGRIDYAGIVTPFGASRLLGLAPAAAYTVQAAITGAMLLLAGWSWQRGLDRNLRAAIMLSATLLAVPLALLYDRVLLLVAIGWLVREGREAGFLSWEKTVLLGVYVATLVEYAVGSNWHVPLGPFISLAVLLMALRRSVPTNVRAGSWMEPRIRRETITP